MKNIVGLTTTILVAFITLLGGCGPGTDTVYTGTVSTIAGMGTASSVDGTGTLAGFDSPLSITTDGTNLYVADSANHTIRKIVIATGVVTTLAGQAGSSGTTDGIGSAARFTLPSGITTDGTDLYVADTGNHTIRQVEIATGNVITFAGIALSPGSNDNPIGTAARFNAPMGLAISGLSLYVADNGNHTIRQITLPAGEVTTLAGDVGMSGLTDSPASAVAQFNNPSGITSDGINLYVADTSNHAVRSVGIAAGDVTTIAGAYPLPTPGSTNGTGTAARFRSPLGIVRSGGSLYVADTGNHIIRQVDIATGTVTTLAGLAAVSGVADGTNTLARFNNPSGITTSGTSLYVADTDNHTIRKIQ